MIGDFAQSHEAYVRWRQILSQGLSNQKKKKKAHIVFIDPVRKPE